MTKAEQRKPLRQARPKSRIPHFKTIEEEAEFWDTHDLTEFEDEFELGDRHLNLDPPVGARAPTGEAFPLERPITVQMGLPIPAAARSAARFDRAPQRQGWLGRTE